VSRRGLLQQRRDCDSSLTDTQPGNRGAGCCAFAPIGRAPRTHKSGKNLAIRTAHGVRSSDDANRRRRGRITFGPGRSGRPRRARWSRRAALSGGALGTGLPLCALRSSWTGSANWACGALWSRRTAFASRPRRALTPSFALRALGSDGPGRAERTSCTLLANTTLWTDGSLRTLCTLRARRTNGAGGASLASGARRTLRPGRRSAAH
jgi:hypothetical protein